MMVVREEEEHHPRSRKSAKTPYKLGQVVPFNPELMQPNYGDSNNNSSRNKPVPANIIFNGKKSLPVKSQSMNLNWNDHHRLGNYKN